MEKLLVQHVEFLLALFLVGEHLHHLLALHHFLDKALFLGQRFLLAHHVHRTLLAQLFRHPEHQENYGKNNQRQPQTVPEHHEHDGEYGQAGLNQGRRALADHLPNGIHVVGVGTHDIAVGVGVEVLNRQLLHGVEHLIPQVFQGSLGDARHNLGVDGGSGHAHQVEHAHGSDDAEEFCLYRLHAHLHSRQDDLIDQLLQEYVGEGHGDGG